MPVPALRRWLQTRPSPTRKKPRAKHRTNCANRSMGRPDGWHTAQRGRLICSWRRRTSSWPPLQQTNSATQSLQSLLLQSRIEQARREADQAESRARDLRAQADNEQRKADQGNNRAQQLTAEQQRLGTVRKRATDPTYTASVRAPNPETPTHVENPPACRLWPSPDRWVAFRFLL